MDLKFSLPDGTTRDSLYQWDTDVDMLFSLTGAATLEAQFACTSQSEAIRKTCTKNSSGWTCKVPDTCLQIGSRIYVYLVGTSSSGAVVCDSGAIEIEERAKPAGYVQKTDDSWTTTDEMMRELLTAKEEAAGSASNAATSAAEAEQSANDAAASVTIEVNPLKTEVRELKETLGNLVGGVKLSIAENGLLHIEEVV